MRAYLTKSFLREAKSDGLLDEDFKDAIRRAEQGLVEAHLGGGLIKQRIPRGNRGAAKGSRAIVFYQRGKIAIFLHVFPKSRKANLSKGELAMYLKAAQIYGALSDEDFIAATATRGWRYFEI